MSKQKIDIKKTGKWFLGFALGKALYDYMAIGEIDFYGVIGIPIIALILMYFVDKSYLTGSK